MRLATASALLAALLLAVPAAALAKTTTLRATLSGSAEVPAGATGASAKVTVTLDSTKRRVCWKFSSLKGVSGPNGAHIHQGAPGRAGSIVVPFGGTYRSKGCQSKVSKSLIGSIRAHPGSYYVNIHSSQFPAGAVRGQLKR